MNPNMRLLVAARSKPGGHGEWCIDSDKGTLVDLSGPNGKQRTSWVFDNVIPETCSNRKAFSMTARPAVDHALAGGFGTIMAYGAAGSGKTHTIFGDDNEENGLAHGAVAYMFDQMGIAQRSTNQESIGANTEYRITCSLFEVRNEKIRDMLSGKENLAVMEDFQGNISVCDLRAMACAKPEHVLVLLNQAKRYRSQSSRNKTKCSGHTVLQIGIECRMVDKDRSVVTNVTRSALALVDVGGSPAPHAPEGDESLASLRRVLLGLQGGGPTCSIQDGKLTHALGTMLLHENAMLSIILTLCLDREHQEETMETLQLATNAGLAINSDSQRPPQPPHYRQPSKMSRRSRGRSHTTSGARPQPEHRRSGERSWVPEQLTPIPRRLSGTSQYSAFEGAPRRNRAGPYSPDPRHCAGSEYDRIEASILDEVDSPETSSPEYLCPERARRLSEIITRPLDTSFMDTSAHMDENSIHDDMEDEAESVDRLANEIDNLLAESQIVTNSPKKRKARSKKHSLLIQKELDSIRHIQDNKVDQILEELRAAKAQLALEEEKRKNAEMELELERHKARQSNKGIEQQLTDAVFERSMLQRSLVQRQEYLESVGGKLTAVCKEKEEIAKRLSKTELELRDKEAKLRSIQEEELHIDTSDYAELEEPYRRPRPRGNSMAKAISVLGLTDGGLQTAKPPTRRRTNSISSLAKSFIHIRRKSLMPSFKI
mmetsp:Transcript_11428/g.20205  ORF Transcript_11428/g.20205 Transcript_11428/m.20205 type:complete len:714 (+) Transcript_11428:332-2473(+)